MVDIPNGITIWHPSDMPAPLLKRPLSDIPGIGDKMAARLAGRDIATVEALLQTRSEQLRSWWGSVNGERMWCYRKRKAASSIGGTWISKRSARSTKLCPNKVAKFPLPHISIVDILIIDTVVMSNPEDHLPLTPAEFQVLLSLAEGERHGYALMQDVRLQTNGQLKIGPGTLYTLLDRLQSAAIIEESPRRPEQNEDQRRRYYRLTRLGTNVLAAEAQRLETLIRAARRRLSQHA